MGQIFKYNNWELRSGFEVEIATQLDELGVKWLYEHLVISYTEPITHAKCTECGSDYSIVKERKYTTDFFIEGFGRTFLIETKGILDAPERKKFQAIRKHHPDLDLRLVFQKNNWITTKRKARYSRWAERNNYDFSIGGVPNEWFHKT